jgi:hypothetical protein
VSLDPADAIDRVQQRSTATRAYNASWPHFGRTTALNAATYCASTSSVSADQRTHGQVAGVGVDLYGSEGWGFESLRARPGHRPLPGPGGVFLLTDLLTAVIELGDRPGEDVGSLGQLLAHDMRVHPKRDRRISVAEPSGHHVDRDTGQQQGSGVNVA